MIMINRIEIINWKGHKKTSINFTKGVNFITGPNGIGKTSLLDAICFGLLGTIEFLASYKRLTFRNLIRNPDMDTEIRISLSMVDGDNYEIIRKIGASRRAAILRNGELVESTWGSVTETVLKLFNSSEDFLGRCVFLTEGDTYEYINRPPGEGLAKHVQGMLGIDSMENLLMSMKTISKQYEQKSKGLREKLSEVSLLDEKDLDLINQYSMRIDTIEQDRTAILKDTKESNKQQEALISRVTFLRNTLNNIINTLKEWNDISANLGNETNLVEFLHNTLAATKKVQEELSKKRDSLSINKGEISAQISNQKAIQDILHTYPEVDVEIERVCPVCKRPLSEHLAEQVYEECRASIEQLQKELKDIEKRLINSEDEISSNNKRLSILNKLEQQLINLNEYNFPKLSIVAIEKRLAGLDKRSARIKQQIEEYQYDSEKLRPELVSLETMKKQLQEKMDPQKLNDINRVLINSSKIEFLSDVLIESLKDSLTKQRNNMLAPLTQELSELWSNYMNREVLVEMGDKFELNIVDSRFDRAFNFSQLSGGEKTALLILTHVLLCKYFSDSDFMLLDEPLEHLDSKNRWALINFLIESCNRGFPNQLIVTTIEEPYVREYLGSSSVQVTSLG